MKNLQKFSFGMTSAIITSMGIIIGLGTLNSGRTSILGSLLVIAIADNISDTLGIHIYQESGHKSQEEKVTTYSNFLSRLLVAMSFVVIVIFLPIQLAKIVTIVWGIVILSLLSYLISKNKETNPLKEIIGHLVVAGIVIIISQYLGYFIRTTFK